MGESERNSKRIAETEILESSTPSFSKKMKFDFDEFSLPSVDFKLQAHLCTAMSPGNLISSATSSNSDRFITGNSSCEDSPVSCCSSNESIKVVKDSLRFIDLEAKSSETESSTCIDRKFSRETTPSSEFHGIYPPASMEKKESSHRRKSPAGKMPSQAEIDAFFAGAEKEEQERFAEKYNYDVAKDMPVEGRYQWICLKPQRKTQN
ncbi:hypothetical protein SADUNF_Sadunf09G0084200 [Salix dunnii]|uniref:Cyclin-dependent kinase inhibitor n=1 Tax=Salix dunnii TaxID=1413687 RepID=A0A835MR76_9ROSI|nr:hypothetical protein SADUNF_Sadunf09G0084200 [Salix dunnii]